MQIPQNLKSTSPVIHEEIINKNIVEDKKEFSMKTINFPSAIKELTNGKKIHKLEWKDKNYYGLLDEAQLRLHKSDGRLYDWIISEGDLLGEDWIILD